MDKVEARAILLQELSHYRERSYDDLLAMVDSSETFQRDSPSGTPYQIQMQVFFDDESQRNLRIMGAIDDGGLRAFIKPLCEDFILAPDGSFIGE
jgi:hypothetical protein